MVDFRGVLIIILVLIAIILTVYFLVENIYIPPGEYAPFVNQTTIRIRCLLNNLYLIPLGQLVSGLSESDASKLVFGASKNDRNNRWQLCQNQGLGFGGSYVVYYVPTGGTSSTIGLYSRRPSPHEYILAHFTTPSTCSTFQGVSPPLNDGKWIQFNLIEKGNTDILFDGTISNVYQILNQGRDRQMAVQSVTIPFTSSNFYVAAFQVPLLDVGNYSNLETSFVIEVID